MENFENIVITIVFVAVITLIVFIYSRKRMKKSWIGTVVKVKERSVHENKYNDSTVQMETYIHIYCNTDDGKRQHVKIEKKACLNFYGRMPVVGDRMEKKPDEWIPRMI
jgi:hypothetical protein